MPKVPPILRFGNQGLTLPHGLVPQEVPLERRVSLHSEYFDSLVGMIPSSHYFQTNSMDESGPPSKFMVKKKGTPVNSKAKQPKRKKRWDLLDDRTVNDKMLKKAGEKREREAPLAIGPGAKSYEELEARIRARTEKLQSSDQPKGENGKRRRMLKSEKESLRKEGGSFSSSSSKKLEKSGGVDVDVDFGPLTAHPRASVALEEQDRKSARRGKVDLAKLLSEARRKEERLRELGEEGKVLKATEDWDKAMKKASGEKIKDDPKLLQKALKRKQKSKEKSRREWAERLATRDKDIAQRQETRTANLKQRRTDKVNRILRRKGIDVPEEEGGEKKRSRKRPGFEGPKGKTVLNGNKKRN